VNKRIIPIRAEIGNINLRNINDGVSPIDGGNNLIQLVIAIITGLILIFSA
jgi:hypothetical protein